MERKEPMLAPRLGANIGSSFAGDWNQERRRKPSRYFIECFRSDVYKRQGGQAVHSENIENYPGVEAGIDGLSLSEKMQRGAERFGAEMVTDEVRRVQPVSYTHLDVYKRQRQGLLDGVAVTGGEPLLRPELPAMLEKIKALGLSLIHI